MSNQNPLLLAADAPDKLLTLLRSNPSLAKEQDSHGYSILHALTSYNHIETLRTVVTEFSLDPNTTLDEDGETALFVAETVQAASTLVEELHTDPTLRNHAGQTAEEKITEEGEFVAVADYLRETRRRSGGGEKEDEMVDEVDGSGVNTRPPPPLPDGVKINIGSMQEDDDGQEPDPEFRRRIEELASRTDFDGEEGQAQLRDIVRDAIRDVGSNDRDVRRRVD